MKKYFEVNKKLWEDKVDVHKNSEFYNLKEFKKGQTSLQSVELNEIGEVKGKKLLHLQCHFGMDSLSFNRMGAKVTGVDFSEKGIALAKELNNALNLNSEFICCNIYDLKEHLNKKFDIVYTSYGTITWLPDLNKWAEIVSHFLKPDGMFYMVEFHPVIWMFDDKLEKLFYPYFNRCVFEEEITGTYADRNSKIGGKEYFWNHPISDILNSLIKNGLQIKSFHEFPFSSYNIFPDSYKDENGNYKIKGMDDKVPIMYSIKAIKNS